MSVDAVLEVLDASAIDAVAIAARKRADTLSDPTQRTAEVAYPTGTTEGCVRCGDETHLPLGWFCRPCRLYMTEVTEDDPLVARYARAADRYPPEDVADMIDASLWDASLWDASLWDARAADIVITSPNADGSTSSRYIWTATTPAGYREISVSAAGEVSAAFAHIEHIMDGRHFTLESVYQSLRAEHSLIWDTSPSLELRQSRYTPPTREDILTPADPDAEQATPCEVCSAPANARNRAERRHPRCTDHPLATPRRHQNPYTGISLSV